MPYYQRGFATTEYPSSNGNWKVVVSVRYEQIMRSY